MTRQKILETAERITRGERQEQYGKPENNFAAIADLWSAYLYNTQQLPEGIDLSPDDVAVMMILFKIGRLATGAGSADTWIDIAGYAACGGEIATARAERAAEFQHQKETVQTTNNKI